MLIFCFASNRGQLIMELSAHILLTYGYVLLFAWVLVEQLGLPLPATPVLLAAGALSVDGPIRFSLAFASGLAATLIADSVWFHVGRRYGSRVMHRLCRMALEPSTCVRRTQSSFGRREGVLLLFAKFVPGLAILAPPVAGQSGMEFAAFLAYDGLGSVLWIGAFLAGGRFFGDALQRDPRALSWVGHFSGALLILGIAGFFLARLLRHRRMIRKLAAARLEPEELKRQLDSGADPFIVDLRHPRDLADEPYTLPRARHFSPDALAARHDEIPRDRDIVLFCNCPSEASAAKTAITLHKYGIDRVRPLRGGYDEWKRRGYPLHAVSPQDSSSTAGRKAIS